MKCANENRGGKAGQRLGKSGQTASASDQQEDDKSVNSLLHNYRTRRPLVLIIDDKYALFPFDLASKGCTYAVLGWYQISYAWGMVSRILYMLGANCIFKAECVSDASSRGGSVIRYKFAFQWCEAQGEPWWVTSTGIVVCAQCNTFHYLSMA